MRRGERRSAAAARPTRQDSLSARDLPAVALGHDLLPTRSLRTIEGSFGIGGWRGGERRAGVRLQRRGFADVSSQASVLRSLDDHTVAGFNAMNMALKTRVETLALDRGRTMT